MADGEKRRRGDRKDAYLVRETDAMHIFMPYLLRDRADNEAVAVKTIDLTAANAYLDRKNAENPKYKYTVFHLILAALGKTIALRPRMNRFIAGHRLYERKKISFSFVAKRAFTDEAEEALLFIDLDRDSDASPMSQMHDKICERVHSVRAEGETDASTDSMEKLVKLPRWILRIVMAFLRLLNYYGKMPRSLSAEDPYYATVFATNLGSIKMSANYHHLANWGTNSFFLVIGEKKPTPFFSADGSCEVREAVELGITIDERIADGTYFANSIKLFNYLIQNPELLEHPVMEPVDMKADEQEKKAVPA